MSIGTKPRIYVASLADYNAGRLHGRWLDAARDTDELWADIKAMLEASPENGICQFCGKPVEGHNDPRHGPFPGNAEEWAIHDYEGFDGLKLSEWESIERVATIAQLIEEHGEAVAHYVDNQGIDDVDLATLEEDFQEAFAGQFDSPKDFAEDLVSELGWGNGEEYLTGKQLEVVWSYLDFEHIANELRISGDYWYADAKELGGGVFVFRSS